MERKVVFDEKTTDMKLFEDFLLVHRGLTFFVVLPLVRSSSLRRKQPHTSLQIPNVISYPSRHHRSSVNPRHPLSW